MPTIFRGMIEGYHGAVARGVVVLKISGRDIPVKISHIVDAFPEVLEGSGEVDMMRVIGQDIIFQFDNHGLRAERIEKVDEYWARHRCMLPQMNGSIWRNF